MSDQKKSGKPVALLSKGFTTLETSDGKYRIITQYKNRDDAWSDYTALCKAEQPAPVAVFGEDIYAVLNELIKHAGWAICSYQEGLRDLPGDLDDLAAFLKKVGKMQFHQFPVAVVMPERIRYPIESPDPEERALVEGWNACLDEVKRLNK